MSVPDERPADELSGAAMFDALHTRFELMTAATRVKASPQSIRVQKMGRWVVVTVRLSDQDVHLRISKQWARWLSEGLNEALR